METRIKKYQDEIQLSIDTCANNIINQEIQNQHRMQTIGRKMLNLKKMNKIYFTNESSSLFRYINQKNN